MGQASDGVVRDGEKPPDSLYDVSRLQQPIKSISDKYELVPAFLKVRGLVKQHIDSFNHFIQHEMKKIINANNRITCDADESWYLR